MGFRERGIGVDVVGEMWENKWSLGESCSL